MNNFKDLDNRKISDVDSTIEKFFEEEQIFEKSIDLRKGGPDFVFYDGPIYANAKPGIHHVFAKTIKDAFCKYKVMNGYHVLRKIGLDTHGLPIEVNVEKKLGFKSKADIENFGIENFCKECNKETTTNIKEVEDITKKMGQFIDTKNPYVTCSNPYIESEWWIINELFKKGLIYKGNKVLPYCPRCGTELSQNEVAQGYKDISVNTVIVPFKLVDEDTYVLVWTTTPWTLIANVALCVNPDLDYLKVNSKGYNFIVSKDLADKVLDEEYTILDEFKGESLKGRKYEQLLPFISVEGKAFEILSDYYVTNSDGTGIVHIAPAFGEDDNRVCKQNGITFINPVGLDGKYNVGPWKGRVVTDSDLEIEIIKYLKENDKLFKKIKMTHEYPHCWRCKNPLIYYAKDAWYVRTTAKKDEIIEANKSINWYPNYVGEKRFNNWLSNMVDWGISRNRYWGCPMPLWECECGHIECVGSFEELREKAIEEVPTDMEMHRPYIDNIHLKCPKCGKTISRVNDVMDVWFDSGSMPYAQLHYPFENKELFESQFPADFIAEGVDQTRGWFYVLLVISVLISDKSSFKNVVVNDMMLDQEGKKMSKSIGNIIDPNEIMDEFGADNIRWYMLYTSPVWTPLKFGRDGLKEVYSKFFNPLRNTYTFFKTYANIDKIDISKCNVSYKDREEIDKWLLSKYNRLVKDVREAFEEYDLNIVTRKITNFVSNDLSNWYIRRNRDRFWSSELDNSKKSVYITTYEVLVGLCKLCAPIIAYLPEEMYKNLTGDLSVHLTDYPKYNQELIDDTLEQKMDLVRDLISIGRMIRETVRIKVRQPLSEVLIDSNYKSLVLEHEDLIKEELNVKNISYIDDLRKYMSFTIKPNYKEVGKTLGSKLRLFENALKDLTKEEEDSLVKGEDITIDLDNERLQVTKDMVLIVKTPKEGFDLGIDNNKFVILNTTLDDELREEGLVREAVSKIQQLRKNNGYEIMDHINIYYDGSDKFIKALNNNIEYIKKETLALSINKEDNLSEEFDINGEKVYFRLERVK